MVNEMPPSDPNVSPLAQAAQAVVGLLWGSPTPNVEVDYTARDCVAGRLHFLLAENAVLWWDRDRPEESHLKIHALVDSDPALKTSILRINEATTKDFLSHYTRFGGQSGFFAYCLFLSMRHRSSKALLRAKESFLNWYVRERSVRFSALRGGIVGAWFPLEWFGDHFNEVAVKVVAAVLTAAGGALLFKARESVRKALTEVKASFDPYPPELLHAKAPDMRLEDFDKYLEESGMSDQFLRILQLTDVNLDLAIDDWSRAFQEFRAQLSSAELWSLDKLLEGPMAIDPRTATAALQSLRHREVVSLVEAAPHSYYAVSYPRRLNE